MTAGTAPSRCSRMALPGTTPPPACCWPLKRWAAARAAPAWRCTTTAVGGWQQRGAPQVCPAQPPKQADQVDAPLRQPAEHGPFLFLPFIRPLCSHELRWVWGRVARPGAASWQASRLHRWEQTCASEPSMQNARATLPGRQSNPLAADRAPAPVKLLSLVNAAAGFQGLECAQLVLTTQAAAPQGRLDFSIEPGLPSEVNPSADSRRRRLRMQPGASSVGQLTARGVGAGVDSCGVPAAPTLHLRLPAGQQLSSIVWRDALNHTVSVQSGASLAAAASSVDASTPAATWTTAAVTLPALYPFAESSNDPSASCDAGRTTCQLAQRRYSVRLLAPDGRHSMAVITAPPPTLAGQQLSISVKHYEPQQLSQEQRSLTLPLGWPSAGTTAEDAGSGGGPPAGVVIYDASGGAELALKDSRDAVVQGSSLPASACSQQWTLSMQLSLSGAALAAAAAQGQASDLRKAGRVARGATRWHALHGGCCGVRGKPGAALAPVRACLQTRPSDPPRHPPTPAGPSAAVRGRRPAVPQPGPLVAARQPRPALPVAPLGGGCAAPCGAATPAGHPPRQPGGLPPSCAGQVGRRLASATASSASSFQL